MKIPVLIVLAVALGASGCQKTPEPKATSGPPLTASNSPSVALPPNQVPPSDGAIPPAAANAPSNASPNNPSQTNPAALSKSHEQSSMPLSGQANNYSPPDTTEQPKK